MTYNAHHFSGYSLFFFYKQFKFLFSIVILFLYGLYSYIYMDKQEKIDLWHSGKRRLNIRLCSDDKILEYYKICQDSGYFLEANKLRKDIIEYRDLIIPDIPLGTIKDTVSYIDIYNYIKDYISDIGDSGEDLFVLTQDNYIYFDWSKPDPDIDWCCRIDIKNNLIDFGPGEEQINISTENLKKILYKVEDELFMC